MESSVRPLQDRINLGNQQLADRNVETTERYSRIAFLQSQLAEARQQRDAAVASPVLPSPTSDSANLMELLATATPTNVNPRVSPDVVCRLHVLLSIFVWHGFPVEKMDSLQCMQKSCVKC